MNKSDTRLGRANGHGSAAIAYGDAPHLSMRQRVEYVVTYALHHDEEPLNLNRVVELVGGDRTAFSKAFRKQMGVTFVDWERERRIARAKILLKESELVVSVAFASGYQDHTTFCRAFRKAEGVSPREYRALIAAAKPSDTATVNDERESLRESGCIVDDNHRR